MVPLWANGDLRLSFLLPYPYSSFLIQTFIHGCSADFTITGEKAHYNFQRVKREKSFGFSVRIDISQRCWCLQLKLVQRQTGEALLIIMIITPEIFWIGERRILSNVIVWGRSLVCTHACAAETCSSFGWNKVNSVMLIRLDHIRVWRCLHTHCRHIEMSCASSKYLFGSAL